MTLPELMRLTAQGFTAADLRALGLIPNGGTDIPKDGDLRVDRKEPQPGPVDPPKPHGREEISIPDPHTVPVPVEPPKPASQQATPDPTAALAALSAKVDSLTTIFQAAARANVNTGGPARIIDPMDSGAESLALLSGYTITTNNGGDQ